MGLIKCPECGQMISEFADKCVSCGCPMSTISQLNRKQEFAFVPSKNKIFSKLGDDDKKFVLSVMEALSDKYTITEFVQFVSFVSRTSGYADFWFTFPSTGLTFGYKDEENKTHKFRIKRYNIEEILTFIKNDENVVEEPKMEEIPKKEDPKKIVDKLTTEETNFIMMFKEAVRNKYGKAFEFKRHEYYFGGKFMKTRTYLLSFIKPTDTLLFRYSVDENHKDTVEVDELTSAMMNKLMGIVSKIVETFSASKVEEIEQSFDDKQNEEEIETPKRTDFLDGLNDDQRKIVKTFQKIIEEHYPEQFMVISDGRMLCFKDAESGNSVFWFINKDNQFLFKHRIKGKAETKTVQIESLDKQEFLNILRNAKESADSYGVSVANQDKDKAQEEAKQKQEPDNANENLKIYEHIRCEIVGEQYNAMPSEKALCRNISKYVLDVLNTGANEKTQHIAIACAKYTFYGHKLEWGKERGIECAKLVYLYFKANTVAEKIKDYEETSKKEIVRDYNALVNFLYDRISGGKAMRCDLCNALTPDFSLVPVEALNDILENFKAYETNC